MRDNVIRVVDAYLDALRAKDLSSAPIHPDIEFESPLSPRIRGAAQVKQVFSGFFPAINGINVTRHVADDEWCCTAFEMDTAFGIVPMVDWFHVVDGLIVSIRVYFDPRPIIEGMSRVSTQSHSA